MNAQPDDMNIRRLMALFEAINPIFDDIETVIGKSKKLESKYRNNLNHLSLYLKVYRVNTLTTEKDWEHRVSCICDVLDGIGKVMTEISNDEEDSKLYIQTGVLGNLKGISQRLSKLIS